MATHGWNTARGISDEHIPALIQLLQDERLSWEAWTEGVDEAPYWAQVHAWRALAQLGAGAAVEPMVDLLIRYRESDFTNADLPEALAMIGPAALAPVGDALSRTARDPEPWTAGALAETLERIASRHPEVREQAVEAVMNQLRSWPDQDSSLNGFLIASLIDMRAVEAAPLMEAAFSR